jgi:hypothetical protein
MELESTPSGKMIAAIEQLPFVYHRAFTWNIYCTCCGFQQGEIVGELIVPKAKPWNASNLHSEKIMIFVFIPSMNVRFVEVFGLYERFLFNV